MTAADRQLISTRRIAASSNPPVSYRVTELYPRVKDVEEVNGTMIKEEVRMEKK